MVLRLRWRIQYVESPEIKTIKENVLYVDKKNQKIYHYCPCDCRSLICLPISSQGWQLIEDDDKISLSPSILNSPCKNSLFY